MSVRPGRIWCRLRRSTAAHAGALLGLLAGAVVLSPVAAAAGVPLPSAAASPGGLYSVSCPAADSCVAVGTRSNLAVGGSLVERWNGTGWSVTASPNPAGSAGTVLFSVACTSSTSCMAVGEYIARANQLVRPAAERWNGKAWSVTAVPFPARAMLTRLAAVSCVTAIDCWAVGWSGTNTLAAHWNGTGWSTAPSPNPHPGQPNVLNGVACPSATDCWAVGSTSLAQGAGSLFEHWNGKSWSVADTAGSTDDVLTGISCFNASACLTGGSTRAITVAAQRWDGERWLTTTPATPVNSQLSWLNAASCTRAATCESVGGETGVGGNSALAESWNGTAWTVQPTPATGNIVLDGVSCTVATNCWAVGFNTNPNTGVSAPAIEHWNGARWSLLS